MCRPWIRLLLACLTVAPARGADAPADWPRFRGPGGRGLGVAADVPSTITAAQIRWNAPLPGRGHSSPVVWGARVFLTCEDPASQRRCLTCLDADTGAIAWTVWLDCPRYRVHPDNSLAAATPAADDRAVYLAWVTAGEVEALAWDHQGQPLWQRRLGAFKAAHGPGASLAIVDDTVVVANDQESPDAAVHGLDRATGASRWTIKRRSGPPSYATPAVYQDLAGNNRIVLASPAHGFTCLDPLTGTQQWAVEDLFTLNVVASPVVAGGLVLGSAGRGGRREAAVVRFEGTGGARLLHRPAANQPYVPTPVVIGGNAFLWDDRGTVSCLDLTNGTVAWSRPVTGPSYTSPVSDGRRLFGISRKGELVVLAAAAEFAELGRFQLPEGTHATPAIAHGSLFIRTFTRLLRVGA